MKFNTTFKKFIVIIKSGIIGALALTGIYLILIIIANIIRVPFIAFLYAKSIAKCSLVGLFISTSSIGFILGLVMRRYFLIIQRGMTPIAIVAIPLIIGAWFFYACAIRLSIPEKMKLADFTNSTIDIHFKVPNGHRYYLDLAVPGVQQMPNGTITSSYKFSGRIRISNGTSVIADFPISSDKVLLASSGFILTGMGLQNTNVPPLSQFIQAQKDYDIQIQLGQPPPPLTSIWLYWLQARIDVKK